VYIHDDALPRLADTCTDDEPIGAVDRVEVVKDASDVVWDIQVLREAMVVGSVRLMRIRMWMWSVDWWRML